MSKNTWGIWKSPPHRSYPNFADGTSNVTVSDLAPTVPALVAAKQLEMANKGRTSELGKGGSKTVLAKAKKMGMQSLAMGTSFVKPFGVESKTEASRMESAPLVEPMSLTQQPSMIMPNPSANPRTNVRVNPASNFSGKK